jgi:hypothetical protein
MAAVNIREIAKVPSQDAKNLEMIDVFRPSRASVVALIVHGQ